MSEHNTNRAQVTALGAGNIGNPITGEMVSRQAAIVFLREALFSAGCVSDQVDAGLRVIEALPAQAQPADHIGDATEMVAPAVKVKLLVWVRADLIAWGENASAGLIKYNLTWTYRDDPEVWFRMVRYPDGAVIYEGGDEDAAYAAAQADYEARILAALEGGDA